MLTIIDSVWLKKKTANDLNPIVPNSVHVQINDRHNHYMQLSAVMIQNYNPSHIINYNVLSDLRKRYIPGFDKELLI